MQTKAIIYGTIAGQPQLITRPIPKYNVKTSILIKVKYAGLNAVDAKNIFGDKLPDWEISRNYASWQIQKCTPGFDFSGIVAGDERHEKSRYGPGTKVYGTVPPFHGTISEYIVAPLDQVAPMPIHLSFEEAAALPLSGLTALQSFTRHNLKQKQHVLIIGASGGTGHVAVQVAKAMGATVTSVCSSRNVKFVREIGSDYVCDYDKGDVVEKLKSVVECCGGPFDMVLDCVSSADISDANFNYERRIREEPSLLNGIYLLLGGRTVDWIKAGMERVCGLNCFAKGRRLCWVRFPNSVEELIILKNMAEKKGLRPRISNIVNFSPEGVSEALAALRKRRVTGKIVVKLDD